MRDAARRQLQDNRSRPFEAYAKRAFYSAILTQGRAVLDAIKEGADPQAVEIWAPQIVTDAPLIMPYRSSVIRTASAFARYAREDFAPKKSTAPGRLKAPQDILDGVDPEDFETATLYAQMYDYLSTYGAARITSIVGTNQEMAVKIIQSITAQAADEGLSIQATAKLLNERIPVEWRRQGAWHAERIARTEVLTAASQGEMSQMRELNLGMKKYWIATRDGRERPEHAQAAKTYNASRAIGIDDVFKVGGDVMDSPRDPNAQAGNVINCRCALGWVRG